MRPGNVAKVHISCALLCPITVSGSISRSSSAISSRAQTSPNTADLHLTAGNTMQRVVQASKTRLINMYKEATVLVGYGLFEETDGEQSRGGIPVEDIFVNVQLVKQEDLVTMFEQEPKVASSVSSSGNSHVLQAGTKDKMITLHNIFQPTCVELGQPVSTIVSILAVGSAGIGKSTTLCCKFPHDWAQGLCLPDVDLLLCITLGEADSIQISSTEELLSSCLDLGGEEKNLMLSFVRENPSRVCVVLDGVDECDLTKCSRFMLKLLKGQPMYKGLRTIVTSRPCPAVHQLAQQGRYDRCLEVVGFSAADVEVFINKVLPADVSSSMIEKLSENCDTASLMTTPFVAAVCCEEYRHKKTLSSCRTSLFQKMLLRLLEVQCGRSIRSLESLPPEQNEVIHELGRLAYVKLDAGEYVFSEADEELAKLSEKAVKLGILVSSQKKLSEGQFRWYRFSHLLLQEFFAAYYAVLCLVRCPGDVDELLARFGFLDAHAKNFIIFLVAMLDAKLVRHLLCVTAEKLHLAWSDVSQLVGQGHMFVTMIDRSGLKKIHGVLVSCMDRSMMESLADILLDGVVPCDGSTFVSNHMSRSREPNDSNFLQSVLEMWMERRPLASHSMLYRSLKQVGDGTLAEMKGVQDILCLTKPQVLSPQDIIDQVAKQEETLPVSLSAGLRAGNPDVRDRLSSLAVYATVTCFQLAVYEYVQHQDPVRDVVQQSSFAFRVMQISGNIHYHSSRIAAVLPLLQSHNTLGVQITEEDDGEPMFGHDGVVKLFQALTNCASVECVLLYHIHLSTKRLSALSDMLLAHQNRVQQFIAVHSVHCVDIVSLPKLVRSVLLCSMLTVLHFNGLQLDAKCVDGIAVALGYGSLPLLKEFHISHTPLYSHGCSSLLLALKDGACSHLCELNLSNTEMSNICATSLCHLLQGNPQLESVFIHGNCLFVTLEDPLSVALWMKVAMVVRRSPNLNSLALYQKSDIPKFSLWFLIFAALVLDDQCCLEVLTCVNML